MITTDERIAELLAAVPPLTEQQITGLARVLASARADLRTPSQHLSPRASARRAA